MILSGQTALKETCSQLLLGEKGQLTSHVTTLPNEKASKPVDLPCAFKSGFDSTSENYKALNAGWKVKREMDNLNHWLQR